MMTQETVNVGLIGCGWAGTERHLPCYAANERASIHAVYDHRTENARATAAKYDGTVAHDDLESLLAEPLDIVSVTTPPWTHSELSCAALRAGCTVLSEKPMAMSRSGAERMLETATETGQHLGIVHNFLFANSVKKVQSLIESGELGTVRSVLGFQTSSTNRHLPDWHSNLPGGLVFDELPHLLYLLDRFAGSLSLSNASAAVNDGTVNSLHTTFRGESDTLASINVVFNAPLSEWYLVVVGSEMVAAVDLFRDIVLTFDAEESHSPREVLSVSLQKMRQELQGVITSGIGMLRGSLKFGMHDVVDDVVEGTLNGTGPTIDGDEGFRIFTHQLEVLKAAGISGEKLT